MGNHDGAENQAANIVPPREGEPLAITLDTSSRAKYLGGVALADMAAPATVADAGKSFFLSIQTDVAFYFMLADNAEAVCDETAVNAAAIVNVVKTAKTCMYVPAGAEANLRLDRWKDRYLIVKGTAAGTIRLYASSDVWRA